VGFFDARLRSGSAIRSKKIMTTLKEEETLSREERFVALAHTYLEFQLTLQSAIDAAEADLLQLDGTKLVAEGA